MPVALLEAMAAGLPVVATRAGGVEEAAVDGHNAYLSAPGDSVGLAEAMIRMTNVPDLARMVPWVSKSSRIGFASSECGRITISFFYRWARRLSRPELASEYVTPDQALLKRRDRLIECFIGENVDFFALGLTLAGLYEQRRATVKLRRVDWIEAPFSLASDVDGLKIAIDVWDHSDGWNASLLEWCDVYAKRNVNLSHPAALQHKIIPFGLNWPCHSQRSMLAALAAIANTLPKASKARLREVYKYASSAESVGRFGFGEPS